MQTETTKLAFLQEEEEETQLPCRPDDSEEAEVASWREGSLAEGKSDQKQSGEEPHQPASIFPSTPVVRELTFLALAAVSKQTAAM